MINSDKVIVTTKMLLRKFFLYDVKQPFMGQNNDGRDGLVFYQKSSTSTLSIGEATILV